MDDPGIDTLDVALPNHLHAQVAIAALRAGKDVLLEKPMTTSAADCDALLVAERESGRLVSVGHELRQSAQWGRIKALLDEDAIGEPLFLNINLFRNFYRSGAALWRYDRARVGSWMLEEAVHYFDLALWSARPRRANACWSAWRRSARCWRTAKSNLILRSPAAPMRGVTALGGALMLSSCALLSQAPSDGRYDGELCVVSGTAAPNCGAAEVWLFNGSGNAQVLVSDIVYRLSLKEGWLDLMLVHGQMPIDRFSASYRWSGDVLHFTDPERSVHYSIRFADPARQRD